METQSSQPFGSPVSSPGLLVPNNSPSYGFPAGERTHPHLLSRALEATIPNIPQQTNTSGFVRPQQVITRLRRSAGVPSLRSNRPRNNSQAQLNEMNNAFFPSQSQEFSQEIGSNYQSVWRQQPGYGQQHDYNQQRAYTQQAGSYNQETYSQQNSFGQESAIADEHAHLQQRLYALAQVISAQTVLSPHVVATLTTELRELSQRHIELRRNFQNESRLVQLERERLAHLMASQQQLIQNAISERDRACTERDRLQAQLTAVQGRQRELEQRLEELEKKNAATIDFLRKQVRFKDEQINGKRSLWLEKKNHRNSGASQISETQDPFATPTAPRSSRLPTNLRTGNPKAELRIEFWPYHDENAVNPGSRAETGSPIPDSKALVPFKTEDEIAREFREDFDAIYELIEDWVRNYAYTVNDDLSQDQSLSHDENLWPFMLSCTYTNFSDAHEHVILLLRNPASRPSLVTRVMIQYLNLSIWKATAFSDFNPKYREKLGLMEMQLKVKGLEPAQRANLVAAQTHAIQCIVESDTYHAFRSHCLTIHTKALRAKLGPLLDAGVPRVDAGKALTAIAVRAWDLAAKMFTSNYTFLFNFPACGSKFLHPSMECDDPNVLETDLQLHIRQAKIKLAIKPIITMRNDRHETITAKKVQNGHVLIFP